MGKLTVEEFDKIKQHVNIGGEALRSVDMEIKRESFLTLGKEIAYSHHEWWNGQGYPEAMRGDQVPLLARIVAVADVYDALTTERPYKKAFSHEQAIEEIRRESGTHFDPEIVEVLLENQHRFSNIKAFSEFEERPEAADELLSRAASAGMPGGTPGEQPGSVPESAVPHGESPGRDE